MDSLELWVDRGDGKLDDGLAKDATSKSFLISIAHYNFCRVHKSLHGETPAMAARLTDHVWSIAELLTESGQIGSEKWICPLLERTVSPPVKNSSKRYNTAMNAPNFHEPEFVTTIDHDSREHPQPQLA